MTDSESSWSEVLTPSEGSSDEISAVEDMVVLATSHQQYHIAAESSLINSSNQSNFSDQDPSSANEEVREGEEASEDENNSSHLEQTMDNEQPANSATADTDEPSVDQELSSVERFLADLDPFKMDNSSMMEDSEVLDQSSILDNLEALEHTTSLSHSPLLAPQRSRAVFSCI